MARPSTTRATRRVPTPESAPTRPLGVYAPIGVQTPSAESSALYQLGQALGLGAAIGGKVVQQRNAHEYEQGVADETMGKTDMARARKSEKYADGAYDVAILGQQQDAENAVAEWANENLDKGLPVSEQARILDQKFMAELGPLAQDPRARRLIAKRFRAFMDSFVEGALKEQAEARSMAAQEVVLRDATVALDNGTFDWNESFEIIRSQTGSPVHANKVLIGTILQKMEDAAAAGDPNWKRYRDMIPTEVVGPNGEKLPGPMYSPQYRAMVLASNAQAEDLFNTAMRQQHGASSFRAIRTLDDMLLNGQPITEATAQAAGISVGNGPEFDLSFAQYAQYIQSSQVAIARKNAEGAELDGYLQARAIHGRWADVVGVPGGPESNEKRDRAYEGWVQSTMMGLGFGQEALGGQGLIANPEALDTVARLSAQEGVPYGPLKDTMSAVNPAAPGDLTERLAAYRTLKARNLSSMYVSDDAALIYEVAISAEQAGETKEGIANTVRTMGDKDTREYVALQMKQDKVRRQGFSIPTGTTRLLIPQSVNSSKLLNSGYIEGRYETLLASALSRNLPLDQAQEFAKARIAESHVAVHVDDDDWVVLPRGSVPDPDRVNEAMAWYVDTLPALKAKAKIPEDEELKIRPQLYNGRQPTFEITRGGGIPVPNTTFTLPGLLAAYDRTHAPKASTARQKAVDKSRENQARKAAFESQPDTTPLIRRDPGGF